MVLGSKTRLTVVLEEGEPPEVLPVTGVTEDELVVGGTVTVFVAGAGAGVSEHPASVAKAAPHRTTVATARPLKLLHPHRT
ncbi:hypothetical protein AVL48_19095 [Amycolatopsis regifaucium]|uniref:Uncharacterized protein n=1 Tax=Amycolatopsis regifaucium TaxID=546365 RepID=A0A154MX88_9PSEU|nr:hypothetical protein AVL48_19095 [Amycolatopsis regifaucium]